MYIYKNVPENSVPENSVPENNVDSTFSQPLQWILCQGQSAKNLKFFFKKLPPGIQTKRQNSTKKSIQISFRNEILEKFLA